MVSNSSLLAVLLIFPIGPLSSSRAAVTQPSTPNVPSGECQAYAKYNGPGVDPAYTLICAPLCPDTCDVTSTWLSYPSVWYESCKCPGGSLPACCHGGVVYVDGDAFSPATQGDCNPPNSACRPGECRSFEHIYGIGAKCQ
jgi:hypothetical protein